MSRLTNRISGAALEQTGNRQANSAQGAGLAALAAIGSCSIANGVLLDTDPAKRLQAGKGIQFTGAGDTRDIPHGLGRPWQGYMVVWIGSLASSFTLYHNAQPAGTESTFVRFNVTAAATIKIWVF